MFTLDILISELPSPRVSWLGFLNYPFFFSDPACFFVAVDWFVDWDDADADPNS